jgi:signal transduction histidine kinase/ligand-binding sensor domain-containing protein
LWVTDKESIGIFDRQARDIRDRIPLRDAAAIPGGRSANPTVTMLEDHAGVLWVASERDGLARVDLENRRLVYFPLVDASRNQGVESMMEDAEGALWIGSNGAGLFRLDRDRGKLVRYRNHPGDPDSLTADRVLALAQDRRGGMWAGTEGGGAVRFERRPIPLHSWSLPSDGGPVSAAFVDSHDNLWIGRRGLVHLVGRDATRSFVLGGPGSGLGNADVRSIAEDREGHIWVAAWGGGLHRYDPRSGHWKVFRHDPANPFSIGHDSVFAVFVDHRGKVWAGTENGLNRFDADSEYFTTFRVAGIGANRERAIDEDAHGALWLATLYTGLHRFDPDTGRFTVYRHSDRPGALSNDALTSVTVDRAGMVWVGSAAGLNRFDPATQKFTAFTERDGLGGNSITGILEDPREGLWMTTNRGLSHFTPARQAFENYDRADGIPADLVSIWPGSDGELLVGAYPGLISFAPPRAAESKGPAQVALTNFELFDTPVQIGGASPLKQAISQTRELTLSHGDRVFAIEFAALNFENPEKTRYRYRLEHFDRQWNERDATEREARYTSIAPGNYVFRVQARDQRGQWSGEASVGIRILPTWWESWWFRTAVMIGLVAITWMIYRLRLRQLASRLNLRLEERLAERGRIAGDLHDTLLQGLISASMHLDVAADDVPEGSPVRKKLDHVLQMMANVAQDGRNAVQGLRSCDSNSLGLEQAFAQIKQEFDRGNTEGPELCVSMQGRPRPLHPVFRDEMYRIGREAVINAFRHSEAKKIEVELEYSHRQFKLAVRDDGCGIDPQVLETGRAGHWGLTGMRERAQRAGAHLHIRTRPRGGTRVEISASHNIAFRAAPPGSRSGISRFLRSITKTG